MSLILKISGLIITALIFAVVLRQKQPEYSLLISLAAVISILIFILQKTMPSVEKISSRFSLVSENSSYIKTAVKVLGIAFLSELVADVCRDNGQTSLAFAAENAGKCLIFILCIPLCLSVLDFAAEFLKL